MPERILETPESFRKLLAWHSQARGRVRPRPVPGQLNNTEAAYAEHLAWQKSMGAIEQYFHHDIKFKLAPGCWYETDFIVQDLQGFFEIHEVKGTTAKRNKHKQKIDDKPLIEDDAHVKVKVAARLYDLFPHFLVYRASSGEWIKEAVPAEDRDGRPQPLTTADPSKSARSQGAQTIIQKKCSKGDLV